MRHPQHATGELIYYWSHHEKLCLVDNKVACMGGLDACYGRWDTHDHPLSDVHPQEFNKTLFPGQDYNNSRMMDFQTVDKFTSNALAIQDAPRMPWHDVSLSIMGPSVFDLSVEFCTSLDSSHCRAFLTALTLKVNVGISSRNSSTATILTMISLHCLRHTARSWRTEAKKMQSGTLNTKLTTPGGLFSKKRGINSSTRSTILRALFREPRKVFPSVLVVFKCCGLRVIGVTVS